MRLLFLAHTSLVSGAERALIEHLGALPPGTEPIVMTPPGELENLVAGLGVPTVTYSGTNASLRLDAHRLVGAIGGMAAAAHGVRAAARTHRTEVIHANSIRAGLMGGLARSLGGPPVVTHVHDVLPRSTMTQATKATILRSSRSVLAVSRYAGRAFAGTRPRIPVDVTYNPLDLARFDATKVSRADARAQLGLSDDVRAVGMIAQITPWKGQDVAIRAITEVSRRIPNARLLLAGETKFVSRETRHDNRAFFASLERLIRELGVEDRVEFIGERADVPVVLRALDAVVMPSWEEPLGRTMLEAMAMGTPVIATNKGGPREVIEEGVTGFLRDPHDPTQWADALERLLRDDCDRQAMGERARRYVTRFERHEYARRLDVIYARAAGRAG